MSGDSHTALSKLSTINQRWLCCVFITLTSCIHPQTLHTSPSHHHCFSYNSCTALREVGATLQSLWARIKWFLRSCKSRVQSDLYILYVTYWHFLQYVSYYAHITCLWANFHEWTSGHSPRLWWQNHFLSQHVIFSKTWPMMVILFLVQPEISQQLLDIIPWIFVRVHYSSPEAKS